MGEATGSQTSILVAAALVAAVALVVVLPTGLAAPWTQAGHDPARTGEVPGPGPSTGDVAFRLRLPGGISDFVISRTGPLILDGAAYVPLSGVDGPSTAPVTDGVVRVDLDTAEVETVVRLDREQTIAGIATDGTRLFVSTEHALAAYELADGEQVWNWSAPPPPISGDAGFEFCSQPVVADATVYHACSHLYGTPPRAHTFVAAVDGETGEEQWTWTPRKAAQRMDTGARPTRTFVVGLSVVGPHVVAPAITEFLDQYTEPCCPGGVGAKGAVVSANVSVHALGLGSGQLEWRHQNAIRGVQISAAGQEAGVGIEDGEAGSFDGFTGGSTQPTGTSRVVYMRIEDEVVALNQGDGTPLWSEPIGEQDVRDIFSVGSFALGEETLFTTSTGTLYGFDRRNPRDQVRMSLDPAANEVFGGVFGGGDIIIADETLYAAAHSRSSNESSIYAVDPATGEVRWKHTMYPLPGAESATHYATLGEGVLVALGTDDSLHVIGETEASLGTPNVTASTEYPDVGGKVRVDLSGTEPGAFGEATRYKTEWGDGNSTGWQEDPVLTHTYDDSGDQTARFVVGNDANQTASTTETFHVGEDPPPDPNFAQKAAQKALAPGNVDITFGVLGLFVAVTGGAVGVTRRYRKRNRLQDELDAIERAYEETKDRPIECEAQLTERKTHARGLMLDGELDEQQFQVVENRVEELLKRLRKRSLDEEFDFLPHGLVKRGQEMLEDGKVSRLEADAFLQAVDEAEMLTDEQRAVVRERIEEWRGRDAGGGGAA